jgi:hypothetical protein
MSSSLSLNVLVYAHVNVGVFTRTPFYLSLLMDSTFLGEFLDAWLYFPSLKVGNTYLYSSFWTIWWRLLSIVVEFGVRLFLTSYAVD